jgi:hypothetical protein
MNGKPEKTIARYFSLEVEVVARMRWCSLIRFRGREFIVDTADLVFERKLKCAA